MKLESLQSVLNAEALWAIAVSGGVDSMTLATLAHRHLEIRPRMFHAVSPAVPASATNLVKAHAVIEGWDLTIIDAREFEDELYRSNPANRCYYCKTHLYRAVFERISAIGTIIASGTNQDDLTDFRPGLDAAKEFSVRHPFVEANMDKSAVREVARQMGLDFSEIPAQPCLASRIQTGIRVQTTDLKFIDRVETILRKTAGERSVVRVRVRQDGISVETDSPPELWPELEMLAATEAARDGYAFTGLRVYERGSSFIR